MVGLLAAADAEGRAAPTIGNGTFHGRARGAAPHDLVAARAGAPPQVFGGGDEVLESETSESLEALLVQELLPEF